MSDFNNKAATWDQDHDHLKRAAKLATYMQYHVDFKAVQTAMEYGSGTGLLSFALKDMLPDIALMDYSVEMTKEAVKKVEAQQIGNLHPVQYDMLTQPLPTDKYDLIYILQTLHHIDDTDLFLSKSAQLLNNKGYLVIIDLVKEDGSFHEDEFHGHQGFIQGELESKLIKAGLTTTHYGICHTIEKEQAGGNIKKYPLFMMVGRKG